MTEESPEMYMAKIEDLLKGKVDEKLLEETIDLLCKAEDTRADGVMKYMEEEMNTKVEYIRREMRNHRHLENGEVVIPL